MVQAADPTHLIYFCDQCGREHRVPDTFAGKMATCSACNHVVFVPPAEPPAPPIQALTNGLPPVGQERTTTANRTGKIAAVTIAIGLVAAMLLVAVTAVLARRFLAGDESAPVPGEVSLSSADVTTDEKWWDKAPHATAAEVLETLNNVTMQPAELFAFARPAVVTVTTWDEEGRKIGTGSGFVLERSDVGNRTEREMLSNIEQGWIAMGESPFYGVLVATNFHVIEAAVDIGVEFEDGEKSAVSEVVTENPAGDLAVLLIHLEKQPTALSLATADLPVGTPILAIGNPHGLTNSPSDGIVSGYRSYLENRRDLQITAAISPGSSGGPVLSDTGKVVGIATWLLEGAQNLNFARPASDLRSLLAREFDRRETWEGRSIYRAGPEAFANAKSDIENEAVRAFEAKDEARAKELYVLASRLVDGKQPHKQCAQALTRICELLPGRYEWLLAYARAVEYDTRFSDEAKARSSVSAERMRLLASEALPLLEDCVKRKPDFAPAYSRIWFWRWTQGQHPEALLAAENEVRLAPYCAKSYMDRGMAFHDLHRSAAALEDYERAAELSPKDWSVAFTIGQTYREMGELAKSIAATEKALQLGYPERWRAEAGIGLGYKELGRYDKALDYLLRSKANGYPDASVIDNEIDECRRKSTSRS